jgi:hypothetical protein
MSQCTNSQFVSTLPLANHVQDFHLFHVSLSKSIQLHKPSLCEWIWESFIRAKKLLDALSRFEHTLYQISYWDDFSVLWNDYYEIIWVNLQFNSIASSIVFWFELFAIVKTNFWRRTCFLMLKIEIKVLLRKILEFLKKLISEEKKSSKFCDVFYFTINFLIFFKISTTKILVSKF